MPTVPNIPGATDAERAKVRLMAKQCAIERLRNRMLQSRLAALKVKMKRSKEILATAVEGDHDRAGDEAASIDTLRVRPYP